MLHLNQELYLVYLTSAEMLNNIDPRNLWAIIKFKNKFIFPLRKFIFTITIWILYKPCPFLCMAPYSTIMTYKKRKIVCSLMVWRIQIAHFMVVKLPSINPVKETVTKFMKFKHPIIVKRKIVFLVCPFTREELHEWNPTIPTIIDKVGKQIIVNGEW